jgi:acyl-ACP thioesterase
VAGFIGTERFIVFGIHSEPSLEAAPYPILIYDRILKVSATKNLPGLANISHLQEISEDGKRALYFNSIIKKWVVITFP